MKKNVFKLLILIFIITVISIYFYTKPHRHEQFKEKWNIEMPPGEEVYCKEHTDFFYGNRDSFVVYTANDTINYKLTNKRNAETEDKVKEIAKRFEVPDNEIPKFSELYWWNKKTYKYGSSLIILYLPSESKYYFIEEYLNSDR